MKTFITAAFIALLTTTAYALDQKPNLPLDACRDEMPLGMPKLAKPGNVIICRTGYALQHDQDAKIPAWVSWTMTPKETIGCVKRTNAFEADESLPKGQRAEVKDYEKSGFDKGHLVPNGDQSWDAQVEFESFYMSNMSPQYPSTNRGIWKQLETATRAWSYESKHEFLVYAGNIWGPEDKTIGSNKVKVPKALFKIVVDLETKQVLAFRFLNTQADVGSDLTPFLTSVEAIEKETGITFDLPQGVIKDSKATAVWPINFKLQADAKAATCK
jgi:endonuclease G